MPCRCINESSNPSVQLGIALIFLGAVRSLHASPPSLPELRLRAARWWHLHVDQVATDPAVFLLEGLLTEEETSALISLQRRGSEAGLERLAPDGSHSFVDIESAPLELNASAVTRMLNSRLAALAGYPETHIEDGYFGLKDDGYAFGNLHVDNFRPGFWPHRVASFVVYLTDDFQGGETVIPFATTGHKANATLPLPPSAVDRWDATLKDMASPVGRTCAVQQLNADGFLVRVCRHLLGDGVCLRWSTFDSVCGPLLREAATECDAGSAPTTVRPKAGGAVLFYDLSEDDEITARAMHGSCGVSGGKKIVLAKFVRGGPRPWNDERKIPRHNYLNTVLVIVGTVLVVWTIRLVA